MKTQSVEDVYRRITEQDRVDTCLRLLKMNEAFALHIQATRSHISEKLRKRHITVYKKRTGIDLLPDRKRAELMGKLRAEWSRRWHVLIPLH